MKDDELNELVCGFDQSHSTMDSCAMEFDSDACALLNPDNAVGSSTIFAGTTQFGRSMAGGNFGNLLPTSSAPKFQMESQCFPIETFECGQSFTIWSTLFNFPIRILLKSSTAFFKSCKTSEISQLKSLEERKKLRFTLQLKDLVLHFAVGTWVTVLEVMLAMSLT